MLHFFHRILELGISGCIQALQRRLYKKIFKLIVIKKSKLSPSNLFAKAPDVTFLEHILKSKEFNTYLPPSFKSTVWIITQADKILQNCFQILGSELTCFTDIPWQQDFKTFDKKTIILSDWHKNPNIFYQDILIDAPAKIICANLILFVFLRLVLPPSLRTLSCPMLADDYTYNRYDVYIPL